VTKEAANHPRDRTVFDRRYLLLGLVPVAVYLVFHHVLTAARPAGLRFRIVDPAAFEGVGAAEAYYRYLWISAFVVVCTISLAVAVGSALSLWAQTPRRDRRPVFGVAAAAAAPFIAAEIVPNGIGSERWYESMGEGLYRSVFGALPPGADAGALLHMLDRGLDLVVASGAIALALLAAALILTLARDRATAPPDVRAAHLARALARQRGYLRQGAAVYIFALIAMLAWMYWPMPFLADDATRDAYRQLVVGAAVLQGVGYSLGIAAIYLPPALLLRRRAFALASEATGDAGAEDWLRDKGLESEPLDQLRQAAALVMPALVGVVPALAQLWR
jgi:hypothetical protein